MINYPACQNGNNLTITRYLRGEENHRNEYEQRTEHIHKIWNKIQVIIKDNLPQWRLILKEFVHLLRQVKHHCDTHNQHNRKEECAEELANDIFVESFHYFRLEAKG